ncbi:hypothetical protein OEA41_002267 [Lepraria neglecta]|uniref:Uncharacterized protein n=1 Tax=Lepraria neglecta TaxID=209136 RepID=A0AAE0DM92_9LECA|nr:hypothetical protein OEA41_002267 [Lepraria neglecta]
MNSSNLNFGSLRLDLRASDRKTLVAVDFIGDEELRHQWFKLELVPSQTRGTSGLACQYPAHNALAPGYDAEKLVTDYLTALRKHTERYLKYKVPETALWSTKIEYIITTPAVWSDRAKVKTRSAAEKAGMGQDDALQIISEPEAAATYVLDAMDPHDVQVGDTFVLCDAGGGTVDLISHTVIAETDLEGR